ncbi:MAG TPA: DUF5343 domain-containing protein [Dehalococcoidia bacterium]|nr:DUF5343 domain-containing protein [Dehalococcoidia bacterium]
MEQTLGTANLPGDNEPGLGELPVHSVSEAPYPLRKGGGAEPELEDRGMSVTLLAGDLLPPYASYSSWVRLLDALVGSLPPVVDESYLASLDLSESSIKPLRSTLRFLGLVARDSRPTERLERLVEALRKGGTAKFEALREMVHDSYRQLFSEQFDLKSAGTEQLRLYFGTMGARGQIQQKCSSFFLNLARDAGLELPPQLISRAPMALGRHRAAFAPTGAIEPQLSTLRSERRKSVYAICREPGLLSDIFPTFDIDWPEEKKQRWFRDFARLVKICEKEGETPAKQSLSG